LGRWISADPLAVHAPGEADLNLYAYVSGAVLKNVDPLGLEGFSKIRVMHPKSELAFNRIRKQLGAKNDDVGGFYATDHRLEAGYTGEIQETRPGKGRGTAKVAVEYSKGADDEGRALRETIVFKNGVRKTAAVPSGDRGKTISGHEYGHAGVDHALRKLNPEISNAVLGKDRVLQVDYQREGDGKWSLTSESQKKIDAVMTKAIEQTQKVHDYLQEVTVHSGQHSADEKKAMRDEVLATGVSNAQLSRWEKTAEAGYQSGADYGNSGAGLGNGGETPGRDAAPGEEKE
jgi:hypothetical protein